MQESTSDRSARLFLGAVDYVFFLGGRDLEMVTIKELLQRELPAHTHDKGLAWGARASDYREEIEVEMGSGKTPVLVELHDDLGVTGRGAILVDHHGERVEMHTPNEVPGRMAAL